MAAETPDIVMMHLGTNDLAQDVADEAPANIRGLIDHICAALPPDGKLYVTKIIPIGGMGNASSLAYNTIIEEAVTEKQALGLPVYLVDAYSIWSNEYISGDWTHPNQTGYDVLGDFWFNVIKNDVQLPCITTIPVTGVSLNTNSATIIVDSTLQLNATITPENATNKSITWSTSDETVATISSSGLVRGISPGNATITVESVDGNFEATSEITVVSIPENTNIVDVTLSEGDIDCYNALQTITIAGNDGSVIIESGANVEFIAGQSIVFLPGFHAQSGSIVHANITTDNSFCTETFVQSIVLAYEKGENIETEKISSEEEIRDIKVYPNPNSGRFVVDLLQFENKVLVIIFNSMGMIVYRNVLNSADENEIDIPNMRNGIYFIKAYSKKGVFTKKIIVHNN